MSQTNAIGTGTRNLCVNAPVDWAEELGRVAGPGRLGQLLRRLIERGAEAEDPALAAKLREIRRQYYGATLLILFCAGLVGVWLGHDGCDMRRYRTRVNTTRRIEGFEFEEAV